MALMGNHNIDTLNSACCRVRGAMFTAEGIQKGEFPALVGGHAILNGEPISLIELAEKLEPLLKALLPPLVKELRELQAEARQNK